MKSDYTSWRPWLRLLSQSRRRLALGLFLMWLTAGSVIGLLTLSGWFITATGVTASLWAAGVAATIGVYVPGAGIRFFALTRTIARYLERVTNHDTVLRVLSALRMTVFQRLVGMTEQRRRSVRASEWLNRLTADIDAMNALYLRLMAPLLIALAAGTMVATFIALFLPQWGFALLVWWWCLVMLTSPGLAIRTRSAGIALTHITERLRAEATDRLYGLGEILAGGHWPWHSQTLRHCLEERRQLENRIDRAIGCAEAAATCNLQLMVAGTLVISLTASANGALSGPLAVMLPFAVLALNEVLAPLAGAAGTYGQTLAAARRLNRLPRPDDTIVPETTPDGAQTASAHPGQPIRLQEVSLTTDNGDERRLIVLPKTNLLIAPGEHLGITGMSGSGKSSLADLLAGLATPASGIVTVGEMRFQQESWPPRHWRRNIGYLTQASDLFNESVRVNLLLGSPDATDYDLWRVLSMVNLTHRVSALPERLDTLVGEFGTRLSGGEARRLALARVILKDPALLVLDEPFTGVDRENRRAICIQIRPWLAGRTVVTMAHDRCAMPDMHRFLTLPDCS